MVYKIRLLRVETGEMFDTSYTYNNSITFLQQLFKDIEWVKYFEGSIWCVDGEYIVYRVTGMDLSQQSRILCWNYNPLTFDYSYQGQFDENAITPLLYCFGRNGTIYKIYSLSNCFANCAIQTIDLSKWYIHSVRTAKNMFTNCVVLNIILNDWPETLINEIKDCFKNCGNFKIVTNTQHKQITQQQKENNNENETKYRKYARAMINKALASSFVIFSLSMITLILSIISILLYYTDLKHTFIFIISTMILMSLLSIIITSVDVRSYKNITMV